MFFDIFNFYGVLLNRKYLNKDLEDSQLTIVSLDQVLINRYNQNSLIIVKGTGIHDAVKKIMHHSKIVYQEGVGFEQIESNSPERNYDNDNVGTPKFRKNESMF